LETERLNIQPVSSNAKYERDMDAESVLFFWAQAIGMAYAQHHVKKEGE